MRSTPFSISTGSALPPDRHGERSIFSEPPSAPPELLPEPVGSTRTTTRLSSYVADSAHVLADLAVSRRAPLDEPSPPEELTDIFGRKAFAFRLGYLALIKQHWVNEGTHLGEVLHSLALAPGESRSIAVLDWYQRQQSRREEQTGTTESMSAEFIQTRALNEVVQTTAREHLEGMTEIDASTRTNGFGLTGGGGAGNAVNTSAAGSLTADLTSLGYPIGASGSGSSDSTNALATAVGTSYVSSRGTVQGVLVSETSGERTVTGELVQNISDATVQNASSARSVMSTVVVSDEQSGGQQATTRVVTNYNHSHALTMQYYEILQKYRVSTAVSTLSPVLYLPFRPLRFSIGLIRRYWSLLRRPAQAAFPGRFAEWDQVVKDFDPRNNAFDTSGPVTLRAVRITRTRLLSDGIAVRFPNAAPEVDFNLAGGRLNQALQLRLVGSATHLSYPVLAVPAQQTELATAVPIEQAGQLRVLSTFTTRLREELKAAIDRAPRRNSPTTNEIGQLSNRNNLRDMVDDGDYQETNPGATLRLDLDIAYTLADRDGRAMTVHQQLGRIFTYGELLGEVDETLGDAGAVLSEALDQASGLNPASIIADIEGFFELHQYAMTRYLLEHLEKEQLIDVLEHLVLSSKNQVTALTDLIDPSPLGIVENTLILRLRPSTPPLAVTLPTLGPAGPVPVPAGPVPAPGAPGPAEPGKPAEAKPGKGSVLLRRGGDLPTLVSHGNPQSGRAPGEGDHDLYELAGPLPPGVAALELEIAPTRGADGRHAVHGWYELPHPDGPKKVATRIAVHGATDTVAGDRISVTLVPDPADLKAATRADIPTLGEHAIVFEKPVPAPGPESPVPTPRPESETGTTTDLFGRYRAEIAALQQRAAARPVTEVVYLPTAGVFGEAILGRSNASEYVDPMRFYHWQDSPIPHTAPQIVAVDLNQQRAAQVAAGLDPTVPDATLLPQAPNQYALPASLGQALQAVQNGTMFTDMSKTAQFADVLGTLAQVASRTAEVAGTLSGQAAANALDAAVALGGQVAGLTASAMGQSIAPPPATPTDRAAALATLDAIDRASAPSGQVSDTGHARGNAFGTPIAGGGSSGQGTGGGTGGGTTTPGGGSTTPGPSTPSTVSTAALRFQLTVPYPRVRMDLADGLMQALPTDELSATLGLPPGLSARMLDAIGSEAVTDLASAAGVLRLLGGSATGATQLLLVIQAVKDLLDVTGLDALFSRQTVQDVSDALVASVKLMQSLFFPAMSGDLWMDFEVRVGRQDGTVFHDLFWNPSGQAAFSYGFLPHNKAVPGAPWWAGGDTGWLLQATDDSIRRTEVVDGVEAEARPDGGVTVRVKADIPRALDWITLLRMRSADIIQLLRDALTPHEDLLNWLATKIGSDPLHYLAAAVDGFVVLLQESIYGRLQQILTPHINLDVAVDIFPSFDGTWRVETRARHDHFPMLSIALGETATGQTREIYAYPTDLPAKLDGPLLLVAPTLPDAQETDRSVPGSWFHWT